MLFISLNMFLTTRCLLKGVDPIEIVRFYDNAKPRRSNVRNFSFADSSFIEQKVNELLYNGVSDESGSP